MSISNGSHDEPNDPNPIEQGDSIERAELNINIGEWVGVEHSAPATYTPNMISAIFLALGPGATIWLGTQGNAAEWVIITVVTIQAISLVLLPLLMSRRDRAR